MPFQRHAFSDGAGFVCSLPSTASRVGKTYQMTKGMLKTQKPPSSAAAMMIGPMDTPIQKGRADLNADAMFNYLPDVPAITSAAI